MAPAEAPNLAEAVELAGTLRQALAELSDASNQMALAGVEEVWRPTALLELLWQHAERLDELLKKHHGIHYANYRLLKAGGPEVQSRRCSTGALERRETCLLSLSTCPLHSSGA